MICYTILIKGNVQGVGFRFFVKNIANRLGISGTVKNLQNKNVEIVAYGKKELIELFLEQCKTGPTHSNVKEILVTETNVLEEKKGFEIIA